MMDKTEAYRKASLYDVNWQVLRVSLLAANSEGEGWATVSGVKQNIATLENYIWKDPDLGDAVERVWRVNNLLSAVLLGYGSRRNEQYKLVKDFHSKVSRMYFANVAKLEGKQWNWDTVKEELIILFYKDPKNFDLIWANLNKRVQTAEKKKLAGTGGMQHRPELEKFLKMMKEIDKDL